MAGLTGESMRSLLELGAGVSPAVEAAPGAAGPGAVRLHAVIKTRVAKKPNALNFISPFSQGNEKGQGNENDKATKTTRQRRGQGHEAGR